MLNQRKKKKNIKARLVIILIILVITPVSWILHNKLEGHNPKIKLNLKTPYLGKNTEIEIDVEDEKSGIRQVYVSIISQKKEATLLKKPFPAGNLLKGGDTKKYSFKINIQPTQLSIPDGIATLRVVVKDYAWRNWLEGNVGYLEKEVLVDTKEPQITVLSRTANVAMGGTGLVLYRLSENCDRHGVIVGERFFKGYSGIVDDPSVHCVFFALDTESMVDAKIYIEATDKAQNIGKSNFSYYIRKKRFKKDKIRLSERFFKQKFMEFKIDHSGTTKEGMVEKFLYINRDIRQKSREKIWEICKTSDRKLYWKGAFLRLPKSAKMAGFGDRRAYEFDNKIIDHQVHYGIDLASNAHSQVPAANKGRVSFTGFEGIFGNTVVIDHGFGVFSLYAHLSGIEVNEGQIVEKGQTIGRTGKTGLAGGDHLHFGMIVGQLFVNPIEWWDQNWLANNILNKIEEISALN